MPTTSAWTFPVNSWYAVAPSGSIGRRPLAARVLDARLAVYRDSRGQAIALADRCCHSSYPLSLGRLEGDDLRCGYSGFLYGPDGRVKAVPTQDAVPVGAGVTSYPVMEQSGFVWVWVGDAGRSRLRSLPHLPWLIDVGWTTFGGDWETRASAWLLQENLADITHIAYLDPTVAPPVLSSAPPPLEVTVSERTVTFNRDYPAAPLQPWQAEVLGVPGDSLHVQRETGQFLAPGLWVDRWDIEVAGHGDADGTKTFYFTHALTPTSASTTRHSWRVSRSFTPSAAATGTMEPLLRAYYERVRQALEAIQQVVDADGAVRHVRVAADAAKTAVAKIMRRMATEDGVASQ